MRKLLKLTGVAEELTEEAKKKVEYYEAEENFDYELKDEDFVEVFKNCGIFYDEIIGMEETDKHTIVYLRTGTLFKVSETILEIEETINKLNK